MCGFLLRIVSLIAAVAIAALTITAIVEGKRPSPSVSFHYTPLLETRPPETHTPIQTTTETTTNTTLKYVTIAFLTVTTGAGLGNVLFETLFLLYAAKMTGLVPVYNTSLHAVSARLADYPALASQLTEVTLQPSEVAYLGHGRSCCEFHLLDMPTVRWIQSNATSHGWTTLALGGEYFVGYQYLYANKALVRSLLTPTANVSLAAEKEIDQLPPAHKDAMRNTQSHKVCIHVRRGDYVTQKLWYTRSTFMLSAANYLGEKHGGSSVPPTIVAVGNADTWSANVLEDLKDKNWTIIAFHMMRDQAVTLALTQKYCDTMLITAPTSTYAFFFGFMTKEGANVYRSERWDVPPAYSAITNIDYIMPPEWTSLHLDEKTLQISELPSKAA